MQVAHYLRNSPVYPRDRSMVPGVVLMALAVAVALFILLSAGGTFETYQYFFLLPWVAGLAIVMAIPSVILHYQGKFTLADPIVFATFSYFVPAFVAGGLFLAAGFSEPFFLSLIQDVKYNLPFTMFLIGLGFASLSLGYFLPIGAKLGSMASKVLPDWNYPDSSFVFPGVVLLLLGVANTAIAFVVGVFGFQKADEINSYDGLIYLTTLFWMQGSFLLWYLFFRQKKINFTFMAIAAFLLTTSLSRALFAGNRGTILQVFSIVALAFVLSGRKVKFKHGAIAAGILSVGMILGMIYGTTFRMVKGSEAKQSASQYAENVLNTFDEVGKTDINETMRFGLANLTERLDVVSTLAVVVSNYEELAPYEEAYGLDNNIWTDSTTFIIPRVIWKDKPSASDARKFSELYFNIGESSFAITPMGDLLRNYGVVGVPIGMFILGVILRFIYRSLVEGQRPSLWRMTLYFMLLTSVSYEAFYGTIIPVFFKVGFTAVVGILIVNQIAKRMIGRPAATA